MTPPGSAGTPADGFRAPAKEGRHRSPEPPPRPGWLPQPTRANTTTLLAAAGLLTTAALMAPAIGAVTPDLRDQADLTPPTVRTRAVATGGPLEMPRIGVVGPLMEAKLSTPSAPREAVRATRGGQTVSARPPTPATEALTAITTASETTSPSATVTEQSATTAETTTAAATTTATTSATPTTSEQPEEEL